MILYRLSYSQPTESGGKIVQGTTWYVVVAREAEIDVWRAALAAERGAA